MIFRPILKLQRSQMSVVKYYHVCIVDFAQVFFSMRWKVRITISLCMPNMVWRELWICSWHKVYVLNEASFIAWKSPSVGSLTSMLPSTTVFKNHAKKSHFYYIFLISKFSLFTFLINQLFVYIYNRSAVCLHLQ